jgi:hypothetical protein
VTGVTGATGLAGPTGPTGTFGLSCWDANGNGVCDHSPPNVDNRCVPTAEDTNGDCICNSLDCQGPQGGQGIQGLQGIQGPAGPTGNAGNTGPAGPTGATGPATPLGSLANLAANSVTVEIFGTANTGLFCGTGTPQPIYEVYVNGVIVQNPTVAPTADTNVTISLGNVNKYIYEVAVHQTNATFSALFGFACNALHNASIQINGVSVPATGANGVYHDQVTNQSTGDAPGSSEPFDGVNVSSATGDFTGGAQRYFLGLPMPVYQTAVIIF